MQIGVIMGGISQEREISLLTGTEIMKNLNRDKYEVIPLSINTRFQLIDMVKSLQFVFIALHGNFGEDGIVQSILETLGISYSGSGVLSSALCMNKNISKKIFISENIMTPEWIMVKYEDEMNYNDAQILGYPLVVKPNSGGSSIATFIVNTKDELKESLIDVLKYDNEAMVEKYIKGDEITCCILNGKILPIISIKPKSEFFNYKNKYDQNGAEEKIIQLPQDIKEKVELIATKCWKIFNLEVYARVDMIIKAKEIYVLEINTLPGMTKNSLFPKSAAAFGLSYTELLDKIIQYSLEKDNK
ncbi:D-alanine--D-alanine ligase [Clostridium estertheticum]|uniref:D-alanine--D-alanine ligase n=1 Tax=Clostridium estertheticum TaxID=238834 RepID=UPI001C7D2DCE|nr:D-alanine--D-alanine ligase [Clostridium estertheticum]MBX4261688.1 D-alanine--D-alanine ligase [Clostridium estertheticum]WLC68600.1 D-alanine--D-alanine ligase [Clostridium estertheticum]